MPKIVAPKLRTINNTNIDIPNVFTAQAPQERKHGHPKITLFMFI